MRKFLLSLILAAVPAASLQAAAFGVTINATPDYVTEGLFSCLSADPGWPCATTSRTAAGLTTASLILTDSGSSSDPTRWTPTSVSTFASLSVTEGHVGKSFSTDASGIGTARVDGTSS
jgi:hypothetical protein